MNIEVVGRHALLFDDDASAGFVNSDAALVEWNSLLIDRYDVRHLLSTPPPSRRRRGNQPHSIAPADLELDNERYLDLPPTSEQQESDEATNQANIGEYNAVAFSYGLNNQNNEEPELESPAYHPTFPIPESLLQSLPRTEKVHQIIARTAMFVSKHGGQSEIVLRVKQGNNPAFGFLMPDHHLHGYFRYLVDHQELLRSDIDEKLQREDKISNSDGGGALSLLGSMYGYDEDEDEDAGESKNESEKIESPASKEPVASVHILPSASKEKPTALKKCSKPESSGTAKKDEEKSRVSSLSAIPKAKPVIVEPPSDLKRSVDKIVEFIVKNGKQFEAVLVEQDIGHARFPFLLSNNQYHSYYLEVLERAQQSKITGHCTHPSEKRKQGLERNSKNGVSKERNIHSEGSAGSDIPYNSKEKFKMVLPKKSKKEEGPDQSSREAQPIRVSVDAAAAAAILQAATRGIKNPNLGFLYKNQDHGDRKSGQSGASEVDSSEAHLTREQKLKAERLKRAKMFVAKLKSGNSEESLRGFSAEPQETSLVNFAAEERDGSSGLLKFDRKNDKIHSGDDDETEQRSKRNYRLKSSRHEDDEDDEDDDDKHSRKKRHRSHRSSHDDKLSRKKHRRSHRDETEGRDEKKYRSHKEGHRKRHVDDDDVASSKSRREKCRKERKEGSPDSDDEDTSRTRVSEVTVVPADLRAKIRAMLKATM